MMCEGYILHITTTAVLQFTIQMNILSVMGLGTSASHSHSKNVWPTTQPLQIVACLQHALVTYSISPPPVSLQVGVHGITIVPIGIIFKVNVYTPRCTGIVAGPQCQHPLRSPPLPTVNNILAHLSEPLSSANWMPTADYGKSCWIKNRAISPHLSLCMAGFALKVHFRTSSAEHFRSE